MPQVTLPESYTLDADEEFMPCTSFDQNELLIQKEYICGFDKPQQPDENSSDSDSLLIIGTTLWFNLNMNLVMRYAGEDSLGDSIWVVDDTAPKYVLSEESGEIIGKIVKKGSGRPTKGHLATIPDSLKEESLSSLIKRTLPKSLDDLLD